MSVSGQAAFEHLRKAAQLAFDQFRLLDQDFENPVLLAIGVDEIVAVDLGAGLELSVDAAVALFETARIPGNVEMEQVPAVGLEVQPLAGGVGGDQDPDRVLLGVRRKCPLDVLTLGRRCRAVVDGDPLAGPVGRGDGGR